MWLFRPKPVYFPKFRSLKKYPDSKFVYYRKATRYGIKYELVIVQFSPGVRDILEAFDQSWRRVRSLSFPYVYLAIFLSDDFDPKVKVFYRKKPFSKSDSALQLPNLSNVSNRGRVCQPITTRSKNLVDKIEDLVSSFWESTFNDDVTSAWVSYAFGVRNSPKSYEEWEERSKVDPNFIFELRFISVYDNVDTLLEDLLLS